MMLESSQKLVNAFKNIFTFVITPNGLNLMFGGIFYFGFKYIELVQLFTLMAHKVGPIFFKKTSINVTK